MCVPVSVVLVGGRVISRRRSLQSMHIPPDCTEDTINNNRIIMFITSPSAHTYDIRYTMTYLLIYIIETHTLHHIEKNGIFVSFLRVQCTLDSRVN